MLDKRKLLRFCAYRHDASYRHMSLEEREDGHLTFPLDAGGLRNTDRLPSAPHHGPSVRVSAVSVCQLAASITPNRGIPCVMVLQFHVVLCCEALGKKDQDRPADQLPRRSLVHLTSHAWLMCGCGAHDAKFLPSWEGGS
jgi:hypothetical protein